MRKSTSQKQNMKKRLNNFDSETINRLMLKLNYSIKIINVFFEKETIFNG